MPTMARGAVLAALALTLHSAGSAHGPDSARVAADATGPDTTTVSYLAGDVRVIQRTGTATDVVAAHIYLLGGTRQLTPATQGIEALLLAASEYGTVHYPGEAARLAWGRTGSRLTLSATEDWTVFGFNGIRQEFDSSWNVLADRLMHPTLHPGDVALVRDRMIAAARQRDNEPDSHLRELADSVAFAGQPYGLQPDGTPESLAPLDSTALARYLGEQIVKSRLLVVVVGNVSRAAVEGAIGRTLAALPAGTYTWTLPRPMARTNSNVVMFQRALRTNYILGLFQGPSADASDAAAFRVATAFLSSRISTSVREEHGLSYAAGAPYLERGVAAGGIYVTTTAPNRVLPMIRAQIDSMKRMHVEDVFLGGFTSQFALDYLADRMTSSSQAEALARAQLYRGDYRLAEQGLNDIRHVNLGRLVSAVERYFGGVHFVFLGDTLGVHRDEFTRF